MPSTVKMLPVVLLHVLCESAMLHESMCFLSSRCVPFNQRVCMQGPCQRPSLYGNSRHL
jgi:hypothetical protein